LYIAFFELEKIIGKRKIISLLSDYDVRFFYPEYHTFCIIFSQSYTFLKEINIKILNLERIN
jgi:hypothetical protein